jgi:hypothetical protein
MKTGRIIKIELQNNGVPVYTIRDSLERVFYPCFATSTSGGLPSHFTSPSIKVNSSVVFVKHDRARVYYIMGFLQDNQDLSTVKLDGVESAIVSDKASNKNLSSNPDILPTRQVVAINQDYNDFHIEDHHVENAYSFINISEPAGVSIAGDPRISMQLPADGLFRISADNVAANKVLNGMPFLDNLFDYIQELENKVNAMSTYISAVAPLVSAQAQALAAIMNASVDGSGTPILNLDIQANNALPDATLPLPQTAAQAKTDCQNTANSYIIIP